MLMFVNPETDPGPEFQAPLAQYGLFSPPVFQSQESQGPGLGLGPNQGSVISRSYNNGTGDLTMATDECYIYTGWRRNQTNLIVSGYEGIPQNLVLNLVCWVIMITLFSILRKKAWNYGRIALVERDRDEARWTTVFYGSTEAGFPVLSSNMTTNGIGGEEKGMSHDVDSSYNINKKRKSNGLAPSGISVSLRITKPSESETELPPESQPLDPNSNSNGPSPSPSCSSNTNLPFQPRPRSIPMPSRLLRPPSCHTERNADTGLFNWIITAVTLSDEQFLLKSGSDAVQYLSFQRHLIFLGSILSVCSLIIILPIHLQGNELRNIHTMEPEVSDFRQSTIMNLTPHSKFLWVHLMFSIVFLLLSILVMRHFSMSLKLVDSELESISRTVIITGMSKHGNPSSARALREHFKEVYPTFEIDEISFAYDLRKLQKCWNLLLDAQRSEEYCVQKGSDGTRLQVTPYFCCCYGSLCSYCGCGIESMDAIEFYSRQVEKYYAKVLRERELLFRSPIGIAFVTFRNTQQAETVVVDYRSLAKWFHQTPESSQSTNLRSDRWTVHFAPVPNDINWENLSLGFKAWCFKFIIVNTILVLVICVYSTPVFILNWLNVYWTIKQVRQSSGRTVGGFLKDTLPTLLLWITAVTLPSVVSVTDRMIGFWTKTAENRSRMIKTFTFLLFMVIILPSLGLTSLVAVVGEPVRWHCIFSSANGSFFVNYVITSCFIGTASELLRFPELFVYAFKLCFTRSSADISSVRKSVLWEFQIGSQYAWMMLNFGIFTLFSLVVPIITPFGLLYLIMKHYVDRYNIYFAYGPVKVDKRVHETAINFGILCMFLLQIVLLAFLNTRIHGHESSKPLQVFSIIGFCITGALFLAQVFFKICASFSPIHYYDKPSAQPPAPDTTDSKTTFKPGHSRNPSSTSTSKEGLPLVYVRQGPGQGQKVGRRKRYCPPVLSHVMFDEEIPPNSPGPGSASATNHNHLQIPQLQTQQPKQNQTQFTVAAKDLATSQV